MHDEKKGGSSQPPKVFRPRFGTMNPPLTPPRRGTDRTRANVCYHPGRGRGWVGSWKGSFRSRACNGTMNLGKRRQAGRTPNASRSPRRSATARQRLECVELAPAFARGSWRRVGTSHPGFLSRPRSFTLPGLASPAAHVLEFRQSANKLYEMHFDSEGGKDTLWSPTRCRGSRTVVSLGKHLRASPIDATTEEKEGP